MAGCRPFNATLMKEQVLSFEEQCLLRDKLQVANKKLAWGAICGFLIFSLILVIPQKFFPIHSSDFSGKSLLQSGGPAFPTIMLLSGLICLLIFFADNRYFRMKRDLREGAKIEGMARIVEISRAAPDTDACENGTRILFRTDAADPKYRTLFWPNDHVSGFREGDTVSFACGKYSGIVLRISRI